MHKLILFLFVCLAFELQLTGTSTAAGEIEILLPVATAVLDIFKKENVKEVEIPAETFFRKVLESKGKKVKKVEIEGIIAIGSQTTIFWGRARVPNSVCFYFFYDEGKNFCQYILGDTNKDKKNYKRFIKMPLEEQKEFLSVRFRAFYKLQY